MVLSGANKHHYEGYSTHENECMAFAYVAKAMANPRPRKLPLVGC